MLMHIISLDIQLPSCVTIHNQCLNIELVSPVYFGNGVVCSKLSDQQISIGTAMRACFEINITQDEFEGALLFKLQRYSDSQYNMDTSAVETDENEATHVYILITWKVGDSKLFAYVALVEHTKQFAWNEDELRKLYDKNHDRLDKCDDIVSNIWLVDNNTTLKTTFEIRSLKGNFGISMSISEERDDYAMRPIWMNTER
jgi:hypothetical protein